MATKKYFLSSALSGQTYNADDLNRIVSFLRTDGVKGSTPDSLLVEAGLGTTVNIKAGVGWVNGCGLVVEGSEQLTLPTEAGNYTVMLQLTESAGLISDIAIVHAAGQLTGNHVLAWVTVSGGSITGVTDKRVNSTFADPTAIVPQPAQRGMVTYTDSISASSTLTKTIAIDPGRTKGLAVVCNNLHAYSSQGIMVSFGTQANYTKVTGDAYSGGDHSGGAWSKLTKGFVTGIISGATFGAGATGGPNIFITDLYIDGSTIKIVFSNGIASAQSLNCVVDWEAE